MLRSVAILGCAALSLTGAALASVPPKRLVLVTPTSVDGTRIGGAARGLYKGRPDYQYRGPTSGLWYLTWWRGKSSSNIWAEQMRSSSGRTAQLGYWGPLRTQRGDRVGTTIDAFKRHWPGADVVSAHYLVHPVTAWNGVVRSGNTIALFTFDQTKKLRGVVVAEAGRVRADTCYLPPQCRSAG